MHTCNTYIQYKHTIHTYIRTHAHTQSTVISYILWLHYSIHPCWPALYSSSALTSTPPWSCRSPWDSRGEGAGSNRHLHPVSPSTVCVQMWKPENISPCNRGHPGSWTLTQGSPKSWLGASTNVLQHTGIRMRIYRLFQWMTLLLQGACIWTFDNLLTVRTWKHNVD